MNKFDELKALLLSDRSVRIFDSSRRISLTELEELVGITRYCASGRNLQPLRYRIVTKPGECDLVFPTLAWAGYYKDWSGPCEKERPVAYIVQCLDTEITNNCLCDDGLHLQTITLGATAKGISGCIIKSFNKQSLINSLLIEKRYVPLYVLALGYAAEKVKIVDLGSDGDIKYYRDEESTQCVPKRPVSDLFI